MNEADLMILRATISMLKAAQVNLGALAMNADRANAHAACEELGGALLAIENALTEGVNDGGGLNALLPENNEEASA